MVGGVDAFEGGKEAEAGGVEGGVAVMGEGFKAGAWVAALSYEGFEERD